MALVSSGNADWQTQNNLGVALFHQEKIQQEQLYQIFVERLILRFTKNNLIGKKLTKMIFFTTVQASAVYEAELTKHLTNCGVITPNAIFPVQRNLMTLNEMYKK